MKKIYLLLVVLCLGLGEVRGQDYVDLSNIDNILPKAQKRMDDAFAVADAVKQAGKWIKSLSDLVTDGVVPLPVGIPGDTYNLIIDYVELDEKTHKKKIHAFCAFEFKDTGQKIAFEGEAILTGKHGVGTQGKLTLIAPVRRDIGKTATIVIREGSSVSFGCEGIEQFDVKMAWVVTSDKIVPVDAQGNPSGARLQVPFEMKFSNFDDYVVSLGINQSFAIKGLKDIVFTLKGATLDQSDTETSSMMKFPEKYFSQGGKDVINMWKGVAIAEASVSLPPVFKKPGTNGGERVTVALKEVLFDENGFTGNVSVTDIISSESIDPESWDISLTDFSLGILKNEIAAFGFGGDVNIPPFGKHSLLPYTATFNPVIEEYEFKAGIAGQYDFPVLSSTVKLNELSTINLLFKNKEIYPSIHASGSLTVNAPLGGDDAANTFSVPDIGFENMVISRESPYFEIGAINITGDLKAPQIGGFDLALNGIKSFKDEKGSGLSFEASISLNDMFGGTVGMQLYGDYQHWKFKEVAVSKVQVDFQSDPFSLSGGVEFRNSDPVFGNGFRGDIKMKLLSGKFNLDAVGVFGKKDAYRYFLADVLFQTQPASGLLIPPGLSFYGVGGGLYSRMQQATKMPTQSFASTDLDFGKSLSGISYIPDQKVGMGFMASTQFALASSEKAFNANVGFEMQFNNHGGLNFVQFRGDAAFMNAADWGSLSNNITSKVKELEQKGGTLKKGVKSELLNKIPANKSTGFLTASVLMEYDNINKTFSADLSAYLNAGIIRGVGPSNRLGWASLYFAPDTWHVYMGTPSDRMGIKVLEMATLDGYFMLGDGIPALPLPPESVLRVLGADKRAKLERSNSSKLGEGKGIAFGAAFNYNFDASLAVFYARLGLGLGAEFMLTDMRGATCSGYSGTPGINGWYAQGQAWAYVDAAIGIQVKFLGSRKRIPILDLSTAALLEGKGPNPLYFAGAVGGRFSALGGLVKGNCNFNFEMGEKCIPVGGSPFGEDIIGDISPATGASDVNVFAAPQVIFNIPVNIEMTIDEEDGSKGTYMVTREEFRVKTIAGGKIAAGREKFSSDGTVLAFTTNEPFESRKDVEVFVKVGFKKKINNKWDYVKGGNGQPVYETKTVTFRSGDRPKEILPEHVKYTYPIDRQYNFYANEYKRGYILTTENYGYLFEKQEGSNQIIRISDSNGKKVYETTFTHTPSQVAGTQLAIDFLMENIPFTKDKIYKLAIVNVPKSTNVDVKSNLKAVTTAAQDVKDVEITKQQATAVLQQVSEQEIYALNFRVSRYNTFKEKINTVDKQTAGAVWPVSAFIDEVVTNMNEPELFDAYEIRGVNGGEQKLVRFTAQVDNTDWYTKSFYQDMYRTQTYVKPPVDKVEIRTGALAPEHRLTSDEINTGMVSSKFYAQTFRYMLSYWCNRDFAEVKATISQKQSRVNGKSIITQQELELLNQQFPPIVSQGNYPVNVSYVLPGTGIVASTTSMTMYNPLK